MSCGKSYYLFTNFDYYILANLNTGICWEHKVISRFGTKEIKSFMGSALASDEKDQ